MFRATLLLEQRHMSVPILVPSIVLDTTLVVPIDSPLNAFDEKSLTRRINKVGYPLPQLNPFVPTTSYRNGTQMKARDLLVNDVPRYR